MRTLPNQSEIKLLVVHPSTDRRGETLCFVALGWSLLSRAPCFPSGSASQLPEPHARIFVAEQQPEKYAAKPKRHGGTNQIFIDRSVAYWMRSRVGYERGNVCMYLLPGLVFCVCFVCGVYLFLFIYILKTISPASNRQKHEIARARWNTPPSPFSFSC